MATTKPVQVEIEKMAELDGVIVPHSYAPSCMPIYSVYVRREDGDGDRLATWASDHDTHEEAIHAAENIAASLDIPILDRGGDEIEQSAFSPAP